MGHRAIIFINNKFTMLQLSKELYEFSIMYNKDQGSTFSLPEKIWVTEYVIMEGYHEITEGTN